MILGILFNESLRAVSNDSWAATIWIIASDSRGNTRMQNRRVLAAVVLKTEFRNSWEESHVTCKICRCPHDTRSHLIALQKGSYGGGNSFEQF